ncbi:MAG: ATP-binding protein, partial [Euryarchaeota archaeon]|nr:ATP-binding protein [Euryarchaeota archaeon]
MAGKSAIVNRSGRKSLLSIQEKVFLHLLAHQRFYQDPDAPKALTQEGIATSTGVGRNNVSKVLLSLAKEGDIEIGTKHVKGLPTVRRVYMLTPKGFSKALELKEDVESTTVKVIDFDGKEKTDEVGKLNIYLPKRYTLLELAMGVSRGHFDCASFHEMKIKEERRFVDYTDRKPTVRVFLGREKELKRLGDFLGGDKGRMLVVHGIPGIGKTTLLAKFAQDVRDQTNVFWYRMHEWVTPKVFLSPLAEFLSQIGRKGLERFLAQNESPGIGEICHILETDLGGAPALL